MEGGRNVRRAVQWIIGVDSEGRCRVLGLRLGQHRQLRLFDVTVHAISCNVGVIVSGNKSLSICGSRFNILICRRTLAILKTASPAPTGKAVERDGLSITVQSTSASLNLWQHKFRSPVESLDCSTVQTRGRAWRRSFCTRVNRRVEQTVTPTR